MPSKVLFLALSVTFLFVPHISWEPLNGFVPNSQGRCVWTLTRTSLNVKVKGKVHQRRFSFPVDNVRRCKTLIMYAVRCKRCHPAADGTIPWQLGDDEVTAVHADISLHVVCVW